MGVLDCFVEKRKLAMTSIKQVSMVGVELNPPQKGDSYCHFSEEWSGGLRFKTR